MTEALSPLQGASCSPKQAAMRCMTIIRKRNDQLPPAHRESRLHESVRDHVARGGVEARHGLLVVHSASLDGVWDLPTQTGFVK